MASRSVAHSLLLSLLKPQFSVLRFELDERHVLVLEAGVAHPLGVDLLRQEVEGGLGEASAHAVEPKVAARFA